MMFSPMADVDRIAKRALCDVRTVERYLNNRPIRALSKKRIERAIRDLKLTVRTSDIRAAV